MGKKSCVWFELHSMGGFLKMKDKDKLYRCSSVLLVWWSLIRVSEGKMVI